MKETKLPCRALHPILEKALLKTQERIYTSTIEIRVTPEVNEILSKFLKTESKQLQKLLGGNDLVLNVTAFSSYYAETELDIPEEDLVGLTELTKIAEEQLGVVKSCDNPLYLLYWQVMDDFTFSFIEPRITVVDNFKLRDHILTVEFSDYRLAGSLLKETRKIAEIDKKKRDDRVATHIKISSKIVSGVASLLRKNLKVFKEASEEEVESFIKGNLRLYPNDLVSSFSWWRKNKDKKDKDIPF